MKTIEEALRNLQKETIVKENLDESQSQEIADSYRNLSKLYGVDVAELVYGPKGFMASHYPNGFDVSADIIFLEDKWNEFEKWVKETKGIDFKAIRQKRNLNKKVDESSKLSYGELSWKMGEVISAMNNEDAYFDSGWLYIWPDEQTEEECLENFGDKESYDDLKAMFKKVYTEYHEDGLYTKKKRIVDFAHEMDKKFNLPPIKNFMDIKESLTDNDNNYKLQISVESGLGADGVDISVFQDDKLTFKKSYRYGYDASYGKSNDPDRPYIGNIIQDYISKYNITEDNFNVIAGKNVFKGEKISNEDVEDFKIKHCGYLVFNDNVAKDVKAAGLTETAENNFISIPRSSKEFDNVIDEYYKKFGKHLQIDTMLYDNQSGKYYMYNESTDYSFTSKRLVESIWNPDFYLKKEPGFEEAINTIKKALWDSSLTPEEITLSVYGSIIRFNKNVKLDTAQMKTLVNKVLAKINPALKAEKLRSMAGKVTFDITGYEYLKDYMTKETESLLTETYSDDELDDMIGDVYNIQKIDNIFRRKKYGDKRLFAHTVCVNCGREKTVFLSNLINDPDKYGSCICSDTNIEAKIDNIQQLYDGSKKLKNNTSGYTGVSFVKTYKGEPYNKWRAYIEVDGVRTYLGDFTSKAKAIKARKEAGEKGIKWYKDNRNKLMRDVRRRSKKYKTSKYRETQKTRKYAKIK